MLNRPPPTAANVLRRERKRRCRHRQANGLVVLRVEAHEDRLAEALLHSGRLTDEQALHRDAIEQAASLIVSDFIARWLGTRPFP
jgi:hypothetical protein